MLQLFSRCLATCLPLVTQWWYRYGLNHSSPSSVPVAPTLPHSVRQRGRLSWRHTVGDKQLETRGESGRQGGGQGTNVPSIHHQPDWESKEERQSRTPPPRLGDTWIVRWRQINWRHRDSRAPPPRKSWTPLKNNCEKCLGKKTLPAKSPPRMENKSKTRHKEPNLETSELKPPWGKMNWRHLEGRRHPESRKPPAQIGIEGIRRATSHTGRPMNC